MCLDKLKELGPSTAREWTSALGYTHSNSLVRVINRIMKKQPEKLKVYKAKRPYRYEAL